MGGIGSDGLTDSERANEERRQKVMRMIDEGWICVQPDALTKARREALEEAVQIADKEYQRCRKEVASERQSGRYINASAWGYKAQSCVTIFRNIRALMEKQE